MNRTARLMVQRKTYRGEDGWSIYGRDGYDRAVRIFTTSRSSAEHIRASIRANPHYFTTGEDFEPQPRYSHLDAMEA